jgi:sporulation protein YlmC with PRC-barrel domain
MPTQQSSSGVDCRIDLPFRNALLAGRRVTLIVAGTLAGSERPLCKFARSCDLFVSLMIVINCTSRNQAVRTGIKPSGVAAHSFSAGTISAPMRLGNQTFRRTTMTTASGHTSAIRAKKVLGTNVTDRSGKKIGEVEDVMLDKESNSILFAVIGFGGFLGIAEKYHPVPWAALDYDESQGSYVVDYTKEQLQAAPAGSIEELTRGDGLQFRDRTYDYYKTPRYWETH